MIMSCHQKVLTQQRKLHFRVKKVKRQAHGGTGFELQPKVENINICQESQSHATAQSKIQISPPKSILQVNFFALAIPTVGLG